MGLGINNEIVNAMMNAGTGGIENNKSKRLAFYASDEAAKKAGFPINHPASFTNPVNGKHLAWIPDDGFKRKAGASEDDWYGNKFEHPNLEKVYPGAMDVPIYASGKHGRFDGSTAGGLYYPGSKEIFINPNTKMNKDGVVMHEMQHWINNKDGLATQQRRGDGSMFSKNYWDGNRRYFASDDEAIARTTQRYINNGFNFNEYGPGLIGIRKEIDSTSPYGMKSGKFDKEK